MGNDLRFGLRMLRKNPGFTLLAVMALALGIGANTAIFSVVNATLIERMPFSKPDRLVMVWEASPRTSQTNVVNPTNFLAWKERNQTFARIAALVEFDVTIAGGGGDPEVIDNLAVSDGFFQILGVPPLVGRWFTPDEDTPGKDRVAILSEGLWRRRFGADPHVVGRTIQLNTRDLVVVGVMPAAFRFPQTKAELWQPLAIDPSVTSRSRYLSTVASLREGATMGAAQADMNRISAQLQNERPDFDSKWGITVVGLREQAVGDVRKPLLVLLGAVGLVLLIACANVANLMLMRAAGRAREIAIRAALGAGAGRIARQLLVESSLFSVLGGAAGLVIGRQMLQLLKAALPDTINYATLKDVRLNATVFLFAAAISLATGILFGLAPALKAVRINFQPALSDSGRGIAGGRGRVRQALVVAEVALSMILLVGAGLLIRSFARLSNVNPGFDARHVISMQLATARLFKDDTALAEFTGHLLERVRALPGVEAAGTSHFLPLGRIIPGTGFWRADRPRPNPGEEPVTDVLVVMPGFFSAMTIPILRGRVFDDHDRAGVPHAVVINETLARQFFPGEDPIGKVLAIQWGDQPYHVVGVVGDIHQRSLDGPVKAEVFLCDLQAPTGPVYLVARTRGPAGTMARAIESEVHSMRKEIAIADVRTMDQYVGGSVAEPRFRTILLGGFSILAVALAAVGIFGVISYSVAHRTREIGIRCALGAGTASVMRLVVGQGLKLAVIGIAIGLGGAFAAARVLQTLLFQVAPTDPITFASAPSILIMVALAASYLPARRAACVDPLEALRHE